MGRPADPDRGGAVGRRVGDYDPRGPGWNAGSGQRRQGFFSTPEAGSKRFWKKPASRSRRLHQLADESPEELTGRQRAARQRAARERAARIEEAIRNCEQLQAEREERAKTTCEPAKEARASTTDPEARICSSPTAGTGPGYNVQFSTDTASGVIVGVAITNAGNDGGELPPMLQQLEERYDCRPGEALVDGGFATKEAIHDAAEKHCCTVYAPLKDEEKQLPGGKDPTLRKKVTRRPSPRGEPAWGPRLRKRFIDCAADRRMGQRAGPQPRLPADAGARPGEMSSGRRSVRDHS